MTDAISSLTSSVSTPIPTASTPNASTADATKALSGNYTMFLKLLTTQLQNQDPLNPTDATTYTQQLVSYSQVEQQIKTNDQLSSILSATKSSANSNVALLNYLGHYVSVSGTQFALQGSAADMTYQLGGAANTVKLDIQDSTGATVASFNGSGGTNVQKVAWNGKDNSGNALPDGTYTLKVTATDTSGNPVAVKSQAMIGKVTGVQKGATTNTLFLGNMSIDESTVTNVYNSPSDVTS